MPYPSHTITNIKKRPLWITGKSEAELLSGGKNTILNLVQDILCLKEEIKHLKGEPIKVSHYKEETIENIKRQTKSIHGLLRVGDQRDSQLIDVVNHIDTLLQQL